MIRCDSKKSFIDEKARAEIIVDARKKGSEGNSICDRNDFICYIQRFVRDTWKRTGSADWAIRDFNPSASWITKHLTEFFPELVDAGDTQNRQRLRVRINCKAGIQQGAVTYAALCGSKGLLYPFDEDAVAPDNLLDIDSFTFF